MSVKLNVGTTSLHYPDLDRFGQFTSYQFIYDAFVILVSTLLLKTGSNMYIFSLQILRSMTRYTQHDASVATLSTRKQANGYICEVASPRHGRS